MKLIEKLNKSYPIEVKLKNDLKNILVVTLLPPAILFLFQPFGVFTKFDFQDLNSWLAICGFGLLSGAISLIFWILLPSLFRPYFEKFNNLQAIFFLLLFTVFISFSIYVYIQFLEGSFRFSWGDYFTVLTRFVIIGLFTSTIIILFSQNRRLKSNLQVAENLNKRIEQRDIPKEKTVNTEKGKEVFKISEETFLFAQSSDNYCTVHFLHFGRPIKNLYRLSLKSLAEQSIELDNIVRCHRSYIVNIKMVAMTQGNSRGLELTLKYVEQTIPVSRRYIQEINKKI